MHCQECVHGFREQQPPLPPGVDCKQASHLTLRQTKALGSFDSGCLLGDNLA